MHYFKSVFLTVFLVSFVFTFSAHSQCLPYYIFSGDFAGETFGISVKSAGDVNNDGFDDIIIGAPVFGSVTDSTGRAYVFSGKTGDTLYVFEGEVGGDWFGYSVSSAGDVNNDNFDDLIIGAHLNYGVGKWAGRVYVFSGRTGDTLYVFSGEDSLDFFGFSVASAGDVNNDGYDDLIIGASGAVNGRVYIFSGQTGDTLYVFNGEFPGDRFGGAVSSAGDVNGDGYDDVIIGARWSDPGGMFAAGTAYVFSGKTGDTLFVFTGKDANDFLGVSVASAGDVDGDGFNDVIVGAYWNSSVAPFAGQAYIFSGQTGDTILVISGQDTTESLGISVAGIGDIDSDGFDDLLIGAWESDSGGHNTGRAYVFSGQTGDTLYLFTGEAADDMLGRSVAYAGDVNNDGIGDIIIGAYLNDGSGTDAGRAYVYTLAVNDCCCMGHHGDANSDGTDANILDLTYVVDFIFRGGLPSMCSGEADLNDDGTPSNILDLTYLIDFIFRGGPAPGPCY